MTDDVISVASKITLEVCHTTIVNKYAQGYYDRVTMPILSPSVVEQIKTPQEYLKVTYTADDFQNIYQIKTNSGASITFATTNCIAFVNYVSGRNLASGPSNPPNPIPGSDPVPGFIQNVTQKRVNHCFSCHARDLSNPVGAYIHLVEHSDSAGNIYLKVFDVGSYCHQGCALHDAAVRAAQGDAHSIYYKRTPDITKHVNNVLGLPTPLPSRHPDLLDSNGGPYTREEWERKSTSHVSATGVILPPYQVEVIPAKLIFKQTER